MRKLLLLLAAGVVALSANAQMSRSVVFTNMEQKQTAKPATNMHSGNLNTANSHLKAAAKTSATGGSRWYNYNEALIAGGITFTGDFPYLWNDTTTKDAYSNASGGTEYDFNTLTSIGLAIDFASPIFNDASHFGDDVQVTSADAITVDSISIEGIYLRNRIRASSAVDTFIFSVVYGAGDSSSNLPVKQFDGDNTMFPYTIYNTDTVRFPLMRHDSLNNRAGKGFVASDPAPLAFKIPVTALDTTADGDSVYQFALPSVLSVPAGNFLGASFTFKSGDTAHFGDTVYFGTGSAQNVKYGTFRPFVGGYGSSTSDFTNPPYNPSDLTTGFFKYEGAPFFGGYYLPTWAYGDATDGNQNQFPAISFHVNCATCLTTTHYTAVSNVAKNINNVTATPNPATSEVSVAYNLANTSSVSVTLTNMVGQVVATQNMGNVASGKATFNVAALPSGVYFYTMNANGERATGRVVVAH